MTNIRFHFLLLSFQLEEYWVTPSKKTKRQSIKQRNCAYRATLISLKIVGYLIKGTELLGLNIRRDVGRLILETFLSYFLYYVYMYFTDGMHFKNIDPDGVLALLEPATTIL